MSECPALDAPTHRTKSRGSVTSWYPLRAYDPTAIEKATAWAPNAAAAKRPCRRTRSEELGRGYARDERSLPVHLRTRSALPSEATIELGVDQVEDVGVIVDAGRDLNDLIPPRQVTNQDVLQIAVSPPRPGSSPRCSALPPRTPLPPSYRAVRREGYDVAANDRQVNQPDDLPPAGGYRHVVAGRGRIVVVSGQLPVDGAGSLVPGDVLAQARQVFAHLSSALAAAESGPADVLRLGVFLLDLADLAAFRAARDEFVGGAPAPASTLVQVAGLAVPGARIEVDALAVAD